MSPGIGGGGGNRGNPRVRDGSWTHDRSWIRDDRGMAAIRIAAVALVVLLVLLALALFGTGILGSGSAKKIESTFDEDAEGWTITGDAQSGSVEPTHNDAGGNPGGYLSARDDVTGGVWYWNASDRYLGDKSDFYGGTLSFDLNQSATDSQFDARDVVLVGNGTAIHYRFDSNPGTNWTGYEVPMTESGWNVSESGDPVTEEQFEAVLANLEALWIRGEYRTGGDVGGLDTVVLKAG